MEIAHGRRGRSGRRLMESRGENMVPEPVCRGNEADSPPASSFYKARLRGRVH